eukprot:m.33129 g.33129  ORF g.33129 m.33129 type:complete len:521 (-) comp16763_c0_seq1:118-1680(-)
MSFERTDSPTMYNKQVRDRITQGCNGSDISFIVLGASGDLAKKKIYPVLWKLWNNGFMGANSNIIGYARSKLTDAELQDRLRPFLPKTTQPERMEEFLKKCIYFQGAYDKAESFAGLDTFISEQDAKKGLKCSNRVFYLALPPNVFGSVCALVRSEAWSKTGYSRVIIEKPFGHDSESSAILSEQLSKVLKENEMYRIDHYLGKEMVQNMLVVRFANTIFTPSWNRDNISSVQISFKEPFGTQGRGGYFDQSGIIRDILQNHLLQVLTIVAMEKPVSTRADDIRDEKVKVLKCIEALSLDDVVLGQYVANPIEGDEDSKMGYKDDPQVPDDSITPTFCTAVMHIRNERWDGVPFIMRAGKALNERKAEIRIQFKDVPGDIFGFGNTLRNELVVRIQPDEAVYLKINNKNPGMELEAAQTYLDLSYNFMYKDAKMPEAYERLILNVINGDQMHFVRSDELVEAWRIFTPLLHSIENKDAGVKVIPYKYGSRGPEASNKLITELGYVYTPDNAEWAKAKANM